MKSNIDIRKAIESAGIKYWQVADKLKLSDGNFSRKLRRELLQEEKQKIFKAIEEVKKEIEIRKED